MSDCGCLIHFEPCDTHAASLEAGEESVHISVRFDDKYSRFKGNNHHVNLERVQRIELGLDGEPMQFTEATLADMLQKMADYRSATQSPHLSLYQDLCCEAAVLRRSAQGNP